MYLLNGLRDIYLEHPSIIMIMLLLLVVRDFIQHSIPSRRSLILGIACSISRASLGVCIGKYKTLRAGSSIADSSRLMYSFLLLMKGKLYAIWGISIVRIS